MFSIDARSASMMDDTPMIASFELWKWPQNSTRNWEHVEDTPTCPDGMSGSLRSRAQCPSLCHRSRCDTTVKHFFRTSFHSVSSPSLPQQQCGDMAAQARSLKVVLTCATEKHVVLGVSNMQSDCVVPQICFKAILLRLSRMLSSMTRIKLSLFGKFTKSWKALI